MYPLHFLPSLFMCLLHCRTVLLNRSECGTVCLPASFPPKSLPCKWDVSLSHLVAFSFSAESQTIGFHTSQILQSTLTQEHVAYDRQVWSSLDLQDLSSLLHCFLSQTLQTVLRLKAYHWVSEVAAEEEWHVFVHNDVGDEVRPEAID